MNNTSLPDRLANAIAWLQIALSPTVIAFLISAIIYYPHKTSLTLLLAVLVLLTGLIFGITWANKMSRKKSAIYFISRTMATPELDDPQKIPE